MGEGAGIFNHFMLYEIFKLVINHECIVRNSNILGFSELPCKSESIEPYFNSIRPISKKLWVRGQIFLTILCYMKFLN